MTSSGVIAPVRLHVGAGLKHHLKDKGSTLWRMLVPRSPSTRIH